MEDTLTSRRFDLESRTLQFAKNVSAFVNSLPKTTQNSEVARQLIRSSGSVGANYIEANESLGKKDFLMRIKISKKESKETGYGLQLVQCEESSKVDQQKLIDESTELMKIFGAILRNSMRANTG